MRLSPKGTKLLKRSIHIFSSSKRILRLDLESGWPFAKVENLYFQGLGTFVVWFIEMPAHNMDWIILFNVTDMFT